MQYIKHKTVILCLVTAVVHLLNDSLHHRRIWCIGNFTTDERFDLAPENSHTAAWTCFKRGENIIAEFGCQHPSSQTVQQTSKQHCKNIE